MALEAYFYNEAPQADEIKNMVLKTFGSTHTSRGVGDDEALRIIKALLGAWSVVQEHEDDAAEVEGRATYDLEIPSGMEQLAESKA